MNDAEIIKGLEDSIEYDCERCPHRPHNDCEWTDCETILSKNILDLIKRQQAEIEKLKKIQQRQADLIIEERGRRYELASRFATAKSEAIKEFAERLKATFPDRQDSRCTLDDCYTLDIIDNLAKEMTGGET